MSEEKPHLSSGSHSINLGSGNSVSHSTLQIGDVHNYGSPSPPVALITRTVTKPVSIWGAPVKAGWFVVSGVLGFIGSIASIVSLWQHLSFWFIVLQSFALFAFVVGVALIRQRFIRIPYLPYNLESNKSGHVFITQIEGNCPLCDGKLRLREVSPQDNMHTYVRSTRNPDHTWNFDFTVLDEPRS